DYVKVGTRPKLFIMTICVGVPAFLLATIDYMFLWRYLGFSNQMVAATMLWVATAYLIKEGKFHFISGLPAIFMTGAVGAYFFYDTETYHMKIAISPALGLLAVDATTMLYVTAIPRQKSRSLTENTHLA